MTWAAVSAEIYLLYGAAFLPLGGTAPLAPIGPEHSIIRHLPWLGAFGLMYGATRLATTMAEAEA